MNRLLVLVLMTAMTALGTEITSPSTPSDQASVKTFNKDVLRVLQKNCQTCHRPGGIAPMPFTTYETTRPWAKAIKAAVISKKMPPWFADPHYGEFRNAPQLVQGDVNTLAAWADGGTLEGNAKDRPAEIKWTTGWRIQPDVILSMPEPYPISATGKGEIQEVFVENPFKEDTWVSAIEIRPGDPSVVHHVIVQIPELGFLCGVCSDVAQQQISAALRRATNLNGTIRQGGSYSDVIVRNLERQTGEGSFMTMEAVYAPGSPPLDFRYRDSAKLIKGGKAIRIEVHYTPNGKATSDQTQVAFTLAKAPAQRRFVMMAPEHLVDIRRSIPAGQPNWETRGELTFKQDAELVWFMPHMHLRGKDMTYKLIYPDGREQTLLSANYDFNWQLGYEVKEPIRVMAGTRMIVTAHHDNSANNPRNPAPGRPVTWGEMTSEEMMLPWFGVVVDRDAEPARIATYTPGDMIGPPVGVRLNTTITVTP
jgi:hypothetical protein